MTQPTLQTDFDLAMQHHQAGRLQDAERIYRQVLSQHPQHADATYYLGLLAKQQGQNDVAIDLLHKAIALEPEDAEAHYNLGLALFDSGERDRAIAAYRQAIAIDPDFPEAYTNLGAALQSDERTADQAIAAYRQAIALRPDFPEAHNNLGNALIRLHQPDEAITVLQKAIGLSPDYADAHYNLALALLAKGDFAAGWEEYEWRWRWHWKDLTSPRRKFIQPQWNGEPLKGRTLLLHAEQGLGDTIQFIRYLPLVVQRMGDGCGEILIECPLELEQLIDTLAQSISPPIPGRCRIIRRGQPLPSFDLHCPLLSLPLAFKTTMDSIPARVPYLFPDPNLIEFWRQRLCLSRAEVKIGLAWAGSPTHKHDRFRSISLDRLSLLADVRGAEFYSLQKGAAAAEARSSPPQLRLVDWTDGVSNFSDAALIANLDLVITVDTSIAHLAGALGRPTWVLLPFTSDWRWLLDRRDSPWYPSMRLFRQPAPGDWDGVVKRVVEALAILGEEKGHH